MGGRKGGKRNSRSKHTEGKDPKGEKENKTRAYDSAEIFKREIGKAWLRENRGGSELKFQSTERRGGRDIRKGGGGECLLP